MFLFLCWQKLGHILLFFTARKTRGTRLPAAGPTTRSKDTPTTRNKAETPDHLGHFMSAYQTVTLKQLWRSKQKTSHAIQIHQPENPPPDDPAAAAAVRSTASPTHHQSRSDENHRKSECITWRDRRERRARREGKSVRLVSSQSGGGSLWRGGVE